MASGMTARGQIFLPGCAIKTENQAYEYVQIVRKLFIPQGTVLLAREHAPSFLSTDRFPPEKSRAFLSGNSPGRSHLAPLVRNSCPPSENFLGLETNNRR